MKVKKRGKKRWTERADWGRGPLYMSRRNKRAGSETATVTEIGVY